MIPFPNLSPDIVSLPLGPVTLTLRWYALAYIVGLLFALWLITRLMRKPELWGDAPPAKPEQIESLLTACILGVILGGRLGFVLFYQPGYYLSQPAEILKVWEGGMSFHGGFLGVVLGGLWFCWRHSVSPLRLGDAMALATPVGLGLGRLTNFVNAELWGRPTTLPWGVIFPGEAAQTCPGVVGPCARHPSQLYEAGLEGLLLGLVLWLMVRRGALRRPGLVMGAFLIGYGLARAFVELFRQADAQFITPENPLGRIVAGLSMGQLLSLPMIGAGLWLVLRARRLPSR